MTKILFNRHEPLYGRSTSHLHLEPFPVSVCKEILRDHNPGYSNDDLLTLWTMTGGVAKYVELFMDNEECIEVLPEILKEGDSILVKASNAMHFTEIVDALKAMK